MSGSRRPKTDHKPSIKYGCSPLDKRAFDFADFDLKGYVSTSENYKSRIPEPRDAEILGTRELISAISSICDYSVRPLSVLLPRSRRRFNEDAYQECDFRCYLPEEKSCNTCATAVNQNRSFNLGRSSHPHPQTSAKLKKLSVRDKILLTGPFGGTESLLRMLLKSSPKVPLESHGIEGLSRVALPIKFRKLYGWKSDTALADPENHENCIVEEKHERDTSDPGNFYIPLVETTSVDGRNPGNPNSYVVNNQHIVSSLGENESHHSTRVSVTTPGSKDVSVTDVEVSAFQIPNSKPVTDSLSNITSSAGDDHEESELSACPSLEKYVRNEPREIGEHNSISESCLPASSKPHYLLAKQEHAFAGAMAGICVSLCLHPIDTIKTVVQSCRANQISLYNVSRSIVSERGAMGLYRGISTNIASSAPISAVYTFTYESVKGTLLSLFPKEYQSLAHCIAGGSASVATSFIFTPSERIKQQMQVGLRYPNCWNALVGIVEKGGLLSLYAGWGAVLCRNVPHSIIKFYTYESLKQLLTPVLPNGQPNHTNTLVTLVSGGFAGSIAALLTTPFDVVKTRLQTQNPGSINQYQSVLIMLKDIAMNEGLKGLYRGLIPRLFMYVTQGGLFFASYESLKRFFSSEEDVLDIKVPAAKQKQRKDDCSSSFFHQDEGISICMLVN